MHVRRALMHLLLTLLLLLSQQAVLSHAATHLGNAPASQDKQVPHSKVCDKCVQGAQLGAALLDSSHGHEWIVDIGADAMMAPVSVDLPRPPRPFSSRAPPLSL